MTNPKGTAFESLGVKYLNEAELNAVRTGSEQLDEADVHFGVVKDGGEWTLEFKDQATITLPAYLKQLEASVARRSAVPFKSAAVVKARGKNVAEAYAVMRFERYRQLACYVLLLEQIAAQATSVQLQRPSELKDLLGFIASAEPHLEAVFGEFAGPEEVEVTEDGTEAPAGAETADPDDRAWRLMFGPCDDPACSCR